jgi:CHASE3 domain sensor protein
MKTSLRTKILGTVSLVVTMLIVLGIVSFWASQKLVSSADEATKRLSDAGNVKNLAILATEMYQHQADLIINRDLETIKTFKNAAEQFAETVKMVSGIVDTPEETGWINDLDRAGKRFVDTFNNGIVPEVKYELEGVLQKLDGETDQVLTQLETYAWKISESMWKEFDEAAQRSNDTDLSKRARDLEAVNKLLFWSLKQYQNQADLIINKDLKSADDFKASVALRWSRCVGQFLVLLSSEPFF